MDPFKTWDLRSKSLDPAFLVAEKKLRSVVKGYESPVVLNMFYFHPYLGKIPILTNIFQMG